MTIERIIANKVLMDSLDEQTETTYEYEVFDDEYGRHILFTERMGGAITTKSKFKVRQDTKLMYEQVDEPRVRYKILKKNLAKYIPSSYEREFCKAIMNAYGYTRPEIAMAEREVDGV